MPMRNFSGDNSPAVRRRSSVANTMPLSGSTEIAMKPSPRNLSMRTPSSAARSRPMRRKRWSSSTAASSPRVSMYSVKPERSTKMIVRGNRMV